MSKKDNIVKGKILHMDNESDVLVSVKAILEREGYEVKSAQTDKEALRAVEKEIFDLVLLDVMMPNLSGWDIFSRVISINPDQKVAFLTVLEISAQRKKDLKRAGVVEYFTKPVNIKKFVKRIDSIVT